MEDKKFFDIATDISQQMVKNDSHAFLLINENEDILKYTVEKYILLNECESDVIRPCGVCAKCKKVLSGNSIEVFHYGLEKALSVENTKDIIVKMQMLPLDLKYNYFILHNFSEATTSAQNKLLKTLEEPNKSSKFILASKSEEGVLLTVKSRSQIFYIKKLNLKEDEVYNVAKFMLMNIMKSSQIHDFSLEMINKKISVKAFLKQAALVLKEELDSVISGTSSQLSVEAIMAINGHMNAALNQINNNVNENTVFEEFLFSVAKEKYNARKVS